VEATASKNDQGGDFNKENQPSLGVSGTKVQFGAPLSFWEKKSQRLQRNYGVNP
jgi:hypothetical protein